MKFWITYFHRQSGKFTNKIPLEGIPLLKLQELFGVPPQNPMYDAYPINSPEKIHFFELFYGVEFNFQEYNYYVETFSDSK